MRKRGERGGRVAGEMAAAPTSTRAASRTRLVSRDGAWGGGTPNGGGAFLNCWSFPMRQASHSFGKLSAPLHVALISKPQAAEPGECLGCHAAIQDLTLGSCSHQSCIHTYCSTGVSVRRAATCILLTRRQQRRRRRRRRVMGTRAIVRCSSSSARLMRTRVRRPRGAWCVTALGAPHLPHHLPDEPTAGLRAVHRSVRCNDAEPDRARVHLRPDHTSVCNHHSTRTDEAHRKNFPDERGSDGIRSSRPSPPCPPNLGGEASTGFSIRFGQPKFGRRRCIGRALVLLVSTGIVASCLADVSYRLCGSLNLAAVTQDSTSINPHKPATRSAGQHARLIVSLFSCIRLPLAAVPTTRTCRRSSRLIAPLTLCVGTSPIP